MAGLGIDWINSQVQSLRTIDAKDRISLLADKESDVGAYLYASGR